MGSWPLVSVFGSLVLFFFFLGVAVEVCQLVFDRTIVLLYLWDLQVLLVYGRT